MAERRKTAFAEILSAQAQRAIEEDPAATEVLNEPPQRVIEKTRPNKAVSPDFTKLTAYIPRTLAGAIKMAMALDQTTDQSAYVEKALVEWLQTSNRDAVLTQVGYKADRQL